MTAEIVQAQDAQALQRAVAVLRAGSLVAFPTDTVYGLAALPWIAEAVELLYLVKTRPEERPIPLLLADGDLLRRVAKVPSRFGPKLEQLVARFWPGGLTLVLPRTGEVPDVVSRGPSVAVRVPDLELARELIRQAGGVLAVTSANLSGRPSACTARQVEADLGGQIELIIDGGRCQGGIASTVLDCTVSPPAILRRGAVSQEELQDAIGRVESLDPSSS